jgi:uncharacterized protein YfdQ (DUF2303 family)
MEELKGSAVNNLLETALEITSVDKLIKIDETPMVVIPEGYKVEDLSKYLDFPLRTIQDIKLATLKSFSVYLEMFKTDATTVFCDVPASQFYCIVDYHRKGNPNNCSHHFRYNPKLDDRYINWKENKNKAMDQKEFATFIENNLDDIVLPSGADVLGMITTFKVIKDVTFSSDVTLRTGEFNFTFSEKNQKGTVDIPETIVIKVPIYEGFDTVSIEIKTRYTLKDGSLSLYYDIPKIKQIEKNYFDEIVDMVAEMTETNVFMTE